MNILRHVSAGVLGAALFVSTLAGCAAPTPAAEPQPTDAIFQIRRVLELPQSPVVFVEKLVMANSPSGSLEVANYRDAEGRIYSVDPITNSVVEIDARAVLADISPSTPALSPDQIKIEAMSLAGLVVPDFDPQRASLQYEEGGKVDNYFFAWRAPLQPGMVNTPVLQMGFHKSGILFEYRNTLLLEK